jgi:hypothetical protein
MRLFDISIIILFMALLIAWVIFIGLRTRPALTPLRLSGPTVSGRQLNPLKNLPCAVCIGQERSLQTAPRGNIEQRVSTCLPSESPTWWASRYAWPCSPYRGRAMPDEPTIREKPVKRSRAVESINQLAMFAS